MVGKELARPFFFSFPPPLHIFVVVLRHRSNRWYRRREKRTTGPKEKPLKRDHRSLRSLSSVFSLSLSFLFINPGFAFYDVRRFAVRIECKSGDADVHLSVGGFFFPLYAICKEAEEKNVMCRLSSSSYAVVVVVVRKDGAFFSFLRLSRRAVRYCVTWLVCFAKGKVQSM